ncbi:MAG: hypothetical protein BWY83_01636 [bacterium ADurb.Bin478]|nr:MAG: hypothetical protein BWY83_01636 [bacterium ADurb.Bin478]
MGNIVVDADGEVIFGGCLFHLVKDRHDHGRSELFGGKAIAAADHLGQLGKGKLSGRKGLGQGRDHIHVEGLAAGARFLGPVQHRNLLDALGQGLEQVLGREGTEKMDLDEADLFALFVEVFDGLFGGLGGRTHDDKHVFGIRVAHIVEEMILAADHLGEFVHRLLDDLRDGSIEGIAGLAALEKDVRILGSAAQHRPIRRKAAQTMGHYQLIIDHGAQVGLVQSLDLLHLVRGAEAVKKVNERNPRLQSGGLGDQGKVMGLLHRIGGDQPPTRGAHRHDVAVVAENRQGMGGHRTGGHVKRSGRKLAGNFKHVRDHQQQSLGRREGGGQRTGLQGAVHCARSAAFALQLGDQRDRPPNVLHAFCRIFVGPFSHGGRRGDRIDRDHLVYLVRNQGRRFIAVDRDHTSCHSLPPGILVDKVL